MLTQTSVRLRTLTDHDVRTCDQVGRIGTERTVPNPSLMALQRLLRLELVVWRD